MDMGQGHVAMNALLVVKETPPLRRSGRSAVRKRPLSLRSLASALLGVAMLASATPLLAQTANTTTEYTYDALDRLTQVTDPSGLNTTYHYDGLSDPTGLTSPDTGVTARTYDAAGNVLTATDAKGILVTYTYDAQNRRLSASYPDSTQNVAYHYDEANSVTGCSSSYPIGHLTRIVETAVTTVYCYDAQGRVIEKQQITGTTTDTTGYAYTSAGRLSGVVYPSGTLVTYTRDSDGRIQSLSVTPPHGTASTAISSVTYQPFGPVSGYTLGNGQAVSRTYDANYRLTDLTSPAFSLHVARDAMGDITAIGNAPGANPATETYRYDPLYRLTAITEAGGSTLQSVTYNPTGDRLSKTGGGLATGTYSYNPNTHQLVATGSYARSVDANGNTTAITAASGNLGFGYNDRNRMILAQVAGSTVGSYTYDALGERIQKVVGTASETYSYDEGQQLLSEQGATNRDYVWMGGIPVANVDTTGTTSTIAYVTADQLGTPRAISDASGTTEWNWPYADNAWGESTPASSGYTYNLRFAGQYFDAETGLMQNGFRDYDSGSGREIQGDPVGLAAGPSLYGYVSGNPLSYIDPLGLAKQDYTIESTVVSPEVRAADERLQKLANMAAANVDATCGWRCRLPWIRGTLVHSEFKRLIDSTCPASHYRTEVSYKNGVLVPYGTAGSSRADVVFGPVSKPLNVYDLKTGWAYLSYGQAKAYGANLPPLTTFSVIRPDGH